MLGQTCSNNFKIGQLRNIVYGNILDSDSATITNELRDPSDAIHDSGAQGGARRRKSRHEGRGCMIAALRAYVRIVDRCNYWIGRVVMYGIFVMMGILLWSSVSTAFFLP